MKLNVKLSIASPVFSETFTCIPKPRAILKRLGIYDQKQLTCYKTRLRAGTKTDEKEALGRGCFKTFLALQSPVSVIKSVPFHN